MYISIIIIIISGMLYCNIQQSYNISYSGLAEAPPKGWGHHKVIVPLLVTVVIVLIVLVIVILIVLILLVLVLCHCR